MGTDGDACHQACRALQVHSSSFALILGQIQAYKKVLGHAMLPFSLKLYPDP